MVSNIYLLLPTITSQRPSRAILSNYSSQSTGSSGRGKRHMGTLLSSCRLCVQYSKAHDSTGYAPFDFIPSRPPPPAELLFFDALTTVETLKCTAISALFIDRAARAPATPEPQAARDRLRQRLAILLLQGRRRLHKAGVRYKCYADRRPVAYDPDNLVEKCVAFRRDERHQDLDNTDSFFIRSSRLGTTQSL
jgi:hypothetical protein